MPSQRQPRDSTVNFDTPRRRTNIHVYEAYEPGGWGLQRPSVGQSHHFACNSNFSDRSQQPKMRYIFLFIKRKKRNSFCAATWNARNPGFYSASAYLAMQSAVLAMVDSVCLTVRPSVTRRYHAKTTPATIMRSSLEDSPMTLVSSTLDFTAKFQKKHRQRGRRMREG